jgi:DNA polymerase III delta subunit
MIYTEKIQTLLESLDGKLKILQNAINGAQQISPSQANIVIEDARKIVERVSELTSMNR